MTTFHSVIKQTRHLTVFIMWMCLVRQTSASIDDCSYEVEGGKQIRLDRIRTLSAPVRNEVFYYNPCNTSKQHDPFPAGCNINSTLCSRRLSDNVTYPYGWYDKVKPFYNLSTKILRLSYNFRHDGCVYNTSVVDMSCLEGEGEDLFKSANDDTCPPEFTLQTKLMCDSPSSGGLSAGSVLLILLFVGVVVYLLGGVLYKRFVKGAQGIEQIPNIEFWRSFPGLVLDGCRFVTRPCRSSSHYDQI